MPVGRVARAATYAEVAGQRGRVAGDVGDRPRAQRGQPLRRPGRPAPARGGSSTTRSHAAPASCARSQAVDPARRDEPRPGAGRAGCAGPPRRRSRVRLDGLDPPAGADVAASAPANSPTPQYRSTARSPGPRPQAGAARRRPARRAAPGCTCQKPGGVDPPGPAAPPARSARCRAHPGAGAPSTSRHRSPAVGGRPPPRSRRRRPVARVEHAGRGPRAGCGDRAVVGGTTLVRAVPAQPEPAVGVDGEAHPGPPAQTVRRRPAPARPPGLAPPCPQAGQPRQLLADHVRLSPRCAAGDVLEVAAAAAGRAGVRAAAAAPGPARARGPRRRPRAGTGAAVALGEPGQHPLAGQRVPDEHRPGPSCRATQCPPWATGPTSSSRPRLRRPASAPPARPSDRLAASATGWTAAAAARPPRRRIVQQVGSAGSIAGLGAA